MKEISFIMNLKIRKVAFIHNFKKLSQRRYARAQSLVNPLTLANSSMNVSAPIIVPCAGILVHTLVIQVVKVTNGYVGGPMARIARV